MTTPRPPLHEVPLDSVWPVRIGTPAILITISEGQWGDDVAAMYEEGFVLLELDRYEHPVRAFMRENSTVPRATSTDILTGDFNTIADVVSNPPLRDAVTETIKRVDKARNSSNN